MTSLPTVENLFDAGAHYGHQKSKSHPKTKPLLHGIINGIYIVNLDLSRAMLERAAAYVKKAASEGKVILLLGTKRQAREAIEQLGKSLDLPFVTNKWLGGMLTNFTTIRASLKKLEELEAKKADPSYSSESKKTQSMVQTQINRLHRTLDGIKKLERVPDVLFVVDLDEEKTAVAEAKRLKIPVVGISDTNVDPSIIEYPIVVNDDSFKTVELIVKVIGESIAEGKKTQVMPKVETSEKTELEPKVAPVAPIKKVVKKNQNLKA